VSTILYHNKTIRRAGLYSLTVLLCLSFIYCGNSESVKGKSLTCKDFQIRLDSDVRFLVAKNSYKDGDYPSAVTTYEDILSDSQKEDNILKVIITLEHLGLLHMKMKKMDKAKWYFEEMNRKNITVKNIRFTAHYHENMGSLLKKEKKHSESNKHLKKALNIYLSCKAYRKTAICLNHIGGNHYYKKEYDKSLKYFLQALKLSERLDNIVLQSLSHYHLGKSFAGKKEYKKAEFFFLKALKLDKSRDATFSIFLDLYELGNLYSERKIWAKAIQFHVRAYEVIKSVKTMTADVKSRYEDILLSLIRLHKSIGDQINSDYYKSELDVFYNKKRRKK